MTTATVLELPPSADLVGAWRLTRPLPVDANGYTSPTIKAWDVAIRTEADGLAPGTRENQLQVPNLNEAVTASPEIVGTVGYTTETYATTHVVTLPGGIQEDDEILAFQTYWTDNATEVGAQTTPTGYTLEWNQHDGSDYHPNLTLYSRTADGSEGGTTVTFYTNEDSFGLVCSISVLVIRNFGGYHVSEVGQNTTANPNPGSIAAVDAGMVITAVGVQWWDEAQATPPSDYTFATDLSLANRNGMAVAYKNITADGTENAGAWAYGAPYTAEVSISIEPASVAPDRTLVVVSTSTDGTASSALAGSDVNLAARNEVQVLDSSLGSGTFTITYDGQTTGTIAFDATAATIETALEGLSNIGSGDVEVTGGPLDTGPVYVEFQGSLAATDVALMSTNSGSVTVTESQKGLAVENFTYEGDINVPRDGGSYEPQLFVWSLTPGTYVPGRQIEVTFGDHDNLKSVAAVLLVLADVDTTDPVETFGTEVTGSGVQADLGPITPATDGSRVIAVVAKALDGASSYYSPAGQATTTPGRTSSVAGGISDAMTLDVFVTPPVDDSVLDLGPVSWSGTEDYAAGLFSLKPAVAPTAALDLYDVVDDQSTDSWLELAATAGDLYEIIEVDMTSVPVDAWITGASVCYSHEADAAHRLRVSLCGINSDGSVVLADDSSGVAPEPLGSTIEVETALVDTLSDGSSLNDFDRLGIVVRSTSSALGLETHRLFWSTLKLQVLTGGPLVSSVAGPSSDGDPITWLYSSAGGFAQTHYQVMIIAGSGQDPDTAAETADPFAPSTGEIIYDSGQVAGSDARSLTIDGYPLGRGNCTVAVRAWASLAGSSVPSDWATANFNITGSTPSGPTSTGTPSLDPATGLVTMSVGVPSGVERAWLLRSFDAGATWAVIAAQPVTASTTEDLIDPDAPLAADSVTYRVLFDSGTMSETSAPATVGSAIDTATDTWFLMSPTDSSLNTPVEVIGFTLNRPRRSVTISRESGASTAISPELGAEFRLRFLTKSTAERLALDAILASAEPIRVVDILGREWLVRPTSGFDHQLQRWAPVQGETTGLRDGHTLSVDLVEVGAS